MKGRRIDSELLKLRLEDYMFYRGATLGSPKKLKEILGIHYNTLQSIFNSESISPRWYGHFVDLGIDFTDVLIDG